MRHPVVLDSATIRCLISGKTKAPVVPDEAVGEAGDAPRGSDETEACFRLLLGHAGGWLLLAGGVGSVG